ncbi:MAG TPA: G/U mismatch-specific DNA glycosylase [Abditibacteriaceae bacterium]|jgi:TDG/mug DNA glycosylase family protein
MPVKPTAEELRAAVNGRTPDILKKNLRVVFCGINPSVYSVVVGHHFARPGNRFWKALHGGGFTPHPLAPHQDRELLNYGCGVTNVVERATVAAADLSAEELAEGGKQLEAKIKKFQPQWLAVLGIGAYRTAFHQPKAVLGLQEQAIGGARVWVLPNPSGLNAHYQPPELARLFREFREATEENTLAG